MSPLKILFNYCQQHHQFQYRMPLHTVHIIRRIIRPNIVHNSHRRQRLHHQPLCRQPVPLSNSTMRKIHRPMTVLHQMHIKVLRPKSRRPVPVNLAVWWVISVRNRMIWKVKYFGLILSVLGSHTKKSYFPFRVPSFLCLAGSLIFFFDPKFLIRLTRCLFSFWFPVLNLPSNQNANSVTLDW